MDGANVATGVVDDVPQSCIATAVLGPTTPQPVVAGVPEDTMPCSLCHCRTAAWVMVPKYPVGAGKLLYELYKSCWSAVTDAPVLPSESEGQADACANCGSTAANVSADARRTVRGDIRKVYHA